MSAFDPSTEFNRKCVAMLKEEFISWRNPPVELPAEWVIARVVERIALAAIRPQQVDTPERE